MFVKVTKEKVIIDKPVIVKWIGEDPVEQLARVIFDKNDIKKINSEIKAAEKKHKEEFVNDGIGRQ